MLDNIKSNVRAAHDRIIEATQAIQFATEFLWHVAKDIEDLARGQSDVEASDVYEYGDRLRFLARIYEAQQWELHKAADDTDEANTDLAPLVLASPVPCPTPSGAD